MPRNKRPVKGVKSIRLAPFFLEILNKLSRELQESEGRVVEMALAEYYRNHPEHWPKEKKEGKE
jgi:hypothetical protein